MHSQSLFRAVLALLIVCALSLGQPGILFAVSEKPITSQTEAKSPLESLIKENELIENDIEELRRRHMEDLEAAVRNYGEK